MTGFFRDIATALIPSKDTSEAPHVFRWRQASAFSIVLIGVTMYGFIALAMGWLSFIGFPGFAIVTDLRVAQGQLADIRVSQIEAAIREAKVANCVAQEERNIPAMRYSSDELGKRLREYVAVTGQPYPRVPECSELIARPPQ